MGVLFCSAGVNILLREISLTGIGIFFVRHKMDKCIAEQSSRRREEAVGILLHTVAMKAVSLFPRRKKSSGSSNEKHTPPRRRGTSPRVFQERDITDLFSYPQQKAAEHLGVSTTSLKKICRKLGIVRWPYTKSKTAGFHTARAGDDDCLPGGESTGKNDEPSRISDACSSIEIATKLHQTTHLQNCQESFEELSIFQENFSAEDLQHADDTVKHFGGDAAVTACLRTKSPTLAAVIDSKAGPARAADSWLHDADCHGDAKTPRPKDNQVYPHSPLLAEILLSIHDWHDCSDQNAEAAIAAACRVGKVAHMRMTADPARWPSQQSANDSHSKDDLAWLVPCRQQGHGTEHGMNVELESSRQFSEMMCGRVAPAVDGIFHVLDDSLDAGASEIYRIHQAGHDNCT